MPWNRAWPSSNVTGQKKIKRLNVFFFDPRKKSRKLKFTAFKYITDAFWTLPGLARGMSLGFVLCGGWLKGTMSTIALRPSLLGTKTL
jgi:hypothetical protein